MPKTEIYRSAVKDIGGNTNIGCFRDSDIDDICKLWATNGLGWFAEPFGSRIDGCRNVVFYRGSSVYDNAQMSRLIENIVQDCKAVGIETLTPSELERLKEGWA